MRCLSRNLLLLLVPCTLMSCESVERKQIVDSTDSKRRAVAVSAPEGIVSFDGFTLPVVSELPSDATFENIKRVAVFIHGSGPQNADGDLSAVSEPTERPNLLYRDIAEALRKKGIATVRFDKRAFEVRARLAKDQSYAKTQQFLNYQNDPLRYFIDDVKAVISSTRRAFPNAKVFLLGHSEGTNLALWIAGEDPSISGLGLIGFANESIGTLVHEQVVARSYLNYFKSLDRNGDQVIDSRELNATGDLARSLKKQLGILDLNQDGKIDLSEYNAGNYSNLVISNSLEVPAYEVTEASKPKPSEVIKRLTIPVVFLQGEFDNQTPAYYAKAVDLANRVVLKKTNLKFVYFQSAGHALDPRNSFADLTYRRIPSTTLSRLADELDSHWK